MCILHVETLMDYQLVSAWGAFPARGLTLVKEEVFFPLQETCRASSGSIKTLLPPICFHAGVCAHLSVKKLTRAGG